MQYANSTMNMQYEVYNTVFLKCSCSKDCFYRLPSSRSPHQSQCGRVWCGGTAGRLPQALWPASAPGGRGPARPEGAHHLLVSQPPACAGGRQGAGGGQGEMWAVRGGAQCYPIPCHFFFFSKHFFSFFSFFFAISKQVRGPRWLAPFTIQVRD